MLCPCARVSSPGRRRAPERSSSALIARARVRRDLRRSDPVAPVAQPGRPLPVRSAAVAGDSGACGSRSPVSIVSMLAFNCLLPAAAAHVPPGRVGELGRARRLSRRRRSIRQRARGDAHGRQRRPRLERLARDARAALLRYDRATPVEDRRAALGQPRPALAADRDQDGKRDAGRPGGAPGRRARRAPRVDPAQARRLDRLVANLLDLSRLEAGAASPPSSSGPLTGWLDRRSRPSDDERITRLLAPRRAPRCRSTPRSSSASSSTCSRTHSGYSSPTDPVEIRAELRAARW